MLSCSEIWSSKQWKPCQLDIGQIAQETLSVFLTYLFYQFFEGWNGFPMPVLLRHWVPNHHWLNAPLSQLFMWAGSLEIEKLPFAIISNIGILADIYKMLYQIIIIYILLTYFTVRFINIKYSWCSCLVEFKSAVQCKQTFIWYKFAEI